MSSSEYTLHNPVTNSSKIIFGKNGFKMVTHDDGGWPLPNNSVLYSKIKQISIITHYTVKQYSSFIVTCSTLEHSRYVQKLEVKMFDSNKLNEAHQFLLAKLFENTKKKDDILGI